MASFDGVFQRFEKKYRIGDVQRRSLEDALSTVMNPDSYGSTYLTSVYFDTPDHDIIRQTIDQSIYREKLRVRAYGIASGTDLVDVLDNDVECRSDEPVFLEIKRKYDGLVSKRRVALSPMAVRAYFEGVCFEEACAAFPLDVPEVMNISASTARQIVREVDAMRVRYRDLAPHMAITCERIAWVPRDEYASDLGDLRVTFDGNLRCHVCGGSDGLAADHSTRGMIPDVSYAVVSDSIVPAKEADAGVDGIRAWHALVGDDETIMEVKTPRSLPLWLAHAMAQVRAFPQAFSKYGTAFQLAEHDGSAHMAHMKTKGGCCA